MSAQDRQREAAGLSGLGLAIAIALALLLLSFVLIAGDMTSSAFSGEVLDTVLSVPIWHSAIGWNIAHFIFALLVVHIGFAIACWLLALLSEVALGRYRSSRRARRNWVLIWSVAGAAWVLIANATLFPHSSLGNPYASFGSATWMGIDALQVASALVAAAIVAALAMIAMHQSSWLGHPRAMTAGATLFLIAATAIISTTAHAPPAYDPNKPNVIIIGIDSLRPDVVGSSNRQDLAPNISRFLSHAVTFSDAITPLARTFPSWISILTGRNPHTTGAVVNLLPRRLIHTGDTLGGMFGRAGYHTVFAMDEVQFSNIDKSYGFDQTITPPMGASDFLLSWFGDTPLSNLILNTRAGSILFPHLYANRGAAATYEPREFVRELDRKLRFTGPTFFAVHLTLAHWPFFWADSPGAGDRYGDGGANYAMAVRRVDRQFAAVMAMLRRRGALRNALVIVLSDHGQALGGTNDFIEDDTGLKPIGHKIFQSHGHGTSILSPHQYHTVLAMRVFGRCNVRLRQPEVIRTPVSLVDLAPTIEGLFDLHANQSFDGRSLVPLLRAQSDADGPFRTRIRFTETEFNPRGVSGRGISSGALAAAAHYYRVNPVTDRVEFRPQRLHHILDDRQYAALTSHIELAAIPNDSGTAFRLIAAQITPSGSLRRIALSGTAADAPLVKLRTALAKRFRIDLPSLPNGPAT